MYQLINGKEVAEHIKQKVKNEIELKIILPPIYNTYISISVITVSCK